MKKEACCSGTPLFMFRWDLKDFQAEGEVEGAGRFQFVGDFVESFFVVYVECEFPDVNADAGFAAPVGFVLLNLVPQVFQVFQFSDGVLRSDENADFGNGEVEKVQTDHDGDVVGVVLQGNGRAVFAGSGLDAFGDALFV